MLRGADAAIEMHGALPHSVEGHARVFYILVVRVGKGLRSGPLHRVFEWCRVGVVMVVVYGRGGLRSVRQDRGSAMHGGRWCVYVRECFCVLVRVRVRAVLEHAAAAMRR
jgi:hypothetical protein